MNRTPHILAINLNPKAATRQGIQHITRVLRTRYRVKTTERHFLRVDRRLLTEVDAIVLGPQGTPFDAYGAHYATLMEVVRSSESKPTLGICGGCQAMVIADGGEIGPLSGGRAQYTYTGHTKQKGWREVRAIKNDPLLPLGTVATVHVSHVEATTKLPTEYALVASSDYCEVQMIRHLELPRWGVQFHPEYGRDGYALLERFLSIGIGK